MRGLERGLRWTSGGGAAAGCAAALLLVLELARLTATPLGDAVGPIAPVAAWFAVWLLPVAVFLGGASGGILAWIRNAATRRAPGRARARLLQPAWLHPCRALPAHHAPRGVTPRAENRPHGDVVYTSVARALRPAERSSAPEGACYDDVPDVFSGDGRLRMNSESK